MAVGSGAPPVNSEKLELGRTPDAVPSENVVVRLDVRVEESDAGGTVAEEVSLSAVLLSIALDSSEVASEDGEDEEAGADDSGAGEEEGGVTDADEGADIAEEAGPAEESAELLEGGATLDDAIGELLGTELLDAVMLDAGMLDAGDGLEGWLEGGCGDSLEEGSGIALLSS